MADADFHVVVFSPAAKRRDTLDGGYECLFMASGMVLVACADISGQKDV